MFFGLGIVEGITDRMKNGLNSAGVGGLSSDGDRGPASTMLMVATV